MLAIPTSSFIFCASGNPAAVDQQPCQNMHCSDGLPHECASLQPSLAVDLKPFPFTALRSPKWRLWHKSESPQVPNTPCLMRRHTLNANGTAQDQDVPCHPARQHPAPTAAAASPTAARIPAAALPESSSSSAAALLLPAACSTRSTCGATATQQTATALALFIVTPCVLDTQLSACFQRRSCITTSVVDPQQLALRFCPM